MKPEDVCLRMPQPDLPIGNCSLDLSKPPPVTYHVDPVEIEEGRARERMSWEVIKPGEPLMSDPRRLLLLSSDPMLFLFTVFLRQRKGHCRLIQVGIGQVR
jgi:hypothetical protein